MGLYRTRLHGIFQARILEWGCHFLLQGIFPIWGWNLGLLHCRQIDALPSEPPGKPRYRIFQARILEWGCHFLLQGIFMTWGWNPGLLRCRQIDALPSEPPGKPRYRIFQARILEWGCHFLHQGIFLTQASNQCLLHCRQILYHCTIWVPSCKLQGYHRATQSVSSLYSIVVIVK